MGIWISNYNYLVIDSISRRSKRICAKEMISLKEIIKNSKSKNKDEWEKYDIITYYIERPLSYLVTWPMINIGMTANAVSFLSIIVSLTALVLMSFSSSVVIKVVGWMVLFFWSILDCVDGNIARYRKTSSQNGELWDATAGYIAMSVLYLSAGMLAANENSIILNNVINPTSYVFIAAITVASCLIPRIVMHKKARDTEGTDNEFKDRASFGKIKIVINGIVSITGIALFLLLPAIIFGFCNIYIIFYGMINVLICIYSLISLLGD